jgi:predicted aspartyl protease
MRRRTLPFFLLLLAMFTQMAASQDAKTAGTEDSLAAADQLYRTGKLEEASQRYEALLSANPRNFHARTKLMEVRLVQQRVDDAYELGKAGMALPAHTAEMLTAMGDVQFRRGEMADAEENYLHAIRVHAPGVGAQLGLNRLYRAYSMYRMAYDQLKMAHEIAPQDTEVQREWAYLLPRKERLKFLDEYLASPHPDDAESTQWMKEYADFLRATASRPAHSCRLVNKVEKTQTPLQSLMQDSTHLRGFGLMVKLNDRGYRMLLDTGASGIIVGRKAVEHAGLEKIARESIGGIGDKGEQSGYTAVAKHIRIGELEFEDCVVEVSDRTSVGGEDGLIGADVFDSYLVDIDGPGRMLRLSALPKRPDETARATALHTDDENAGAMENVGGDGNNDAPAELPRDRYVAPEMASWTRVVRFGHDLLIPTRVNDLPSMFFIIDTGSFDNTMGTSAARKVSKVYQDDTITVKGLSGEVNKVYTVNKATLQFSRFRQENENVVTYDLSNLSKSEGTEISGFLGFEMLRMLELKIDYRDGLVDFSYDPKRISPFAP